MVHTPRYLYRPTSLLPVPSRRSRRVRGVSVTRMDTWGEEEDMRGVLQLYCRPWDHRHLCFTSGVRFFPRPNFLIFFGLQWYLDYLGTWYIELRTLFLFVSTTNSESVIKRKIYLDLSQYYLCVGITVCVSDLSPKDHGNYSVTRSDTEWGRPSRVRLKEETLLLGLL